ncbi:hypothetical protein LVJ94_30830 [Pendulispora rubella]|uniref:RCC1-like domain-containing protein n=2 Tax=Pendulispora rubella TaxID=2741070 RepID=A0ABZ2KWC0_9BACT
MDDGRVLCWGENKYGQLGNPQTTELPDGSISFDGRPVPSPLLASVTNATQLAMGDAFDEDGQPAKATCAILADAQAQCWGQNRYRALGRPPSSIGDDYIPHPEALPVSNLGPSQQIVTTGMTSCAVSDGKAWCWGRSQNWTEGGGGAIPTKVDYRYPIKQIALGERFGAALDNSGFVHGWGDNSSGQLASSPNAMFEQALEIVAGNATACARVRSGDVMCIGSNVSGLLGRDTFDAPQANVAAPVALPTNKVAAKQLAMGFGHACALLNDGTVWCWGANFYGTLGAGHSNGTSVEPRSSSLPLQVQDLPGSAIGIAAGAGFTCALLSNQTVMCWGRNQSGTLGQGTLDSLPHVTPVRVWL